MLRLCLAATLLCLASALPTIKNADHPGRVHGEYLVLLKPAPEGKAAMARYVQEVVAKIQSISADIRILAQFDALNPPILHLKSDDLTMTQAFQVPEVVTIEADVYQKMIEQCASQDASQYWGLDRIDSRSGLDGTYDYTESGGRGVTVYVLDTGIRLTHSDFGGRATRGPNYTNNNPGDVQGHGTHCAGTVGGALSGVAKGVSIVDVKVLGDTGSGQWAWTISGLNHVAGQSGDRVASLSLGGGATETVDSAVNSAVAAGAFVVVAAGNSNANACNFSPARAAQAFTVASSTNTDARSGFSNIGNCCDIFAPGSNILSTSHQGDNSFRTLSGTSMACPHVAGSAAVYLGRNPGSSPAAVRSGLTDQATPNAISNPGTGTPNLLLFEDC